MTCLLAAAEALPAAEPVAQPAPATDVATGTPDASSAEYLTTASGSIQFVGTVSKRWVVVPPAGPNTITAWFSAFTAGGATVSLYDTANPFLPASHTLSADSPPFGPIQVFGTAQTVAMAVAVTGGTADTTFTMHYSTVGCNDTTPGAGVNVDTTHLSFTDGTDAGTPYPPGYRVCRWFLNPASVQPLSEKLPSMTLVLSFARVSLNPSDTISITAVDSFTRRNSMVATLSEYDSQALVPVEGATMVIVEMTVLSRGGGGTGFSLQFWTQPPGACGLTLANTVGDRLFANRPIDPSATCDISVKPDKAVNQFTLGFDDLELATGDSLLVTASAAGVDYSSKFTTKPTSPLVFEATSPDTFDVKVELTTTGTTASRALSASYAAGTCGNLRTLWYNGTSGSFTDGSAAHTAYPTRRAGANCSWSIAPPGAGPTAPVVFRIPRLELCGADYITLRERVAATGAQGPTVLQSGKAFQRSVELVSVLTGAAELALQFTGCNQDREKATGFEVLYGMPTVPDDVCGTNQVVTTTVATAVGLSTAAAHKTPCTWTIQPEPVAGTTTGVYQVTLALQDLDLVAGDTLNVYSLDKVTGTKTLVTSVTGSTMPDTPAVVMGDTSTGRSAAAVVELVPAAAAAGRADDAASDATAAGSTFTMSVLPGQCVAGLPTVLAATSGSFSDGSAPSRPMVNTAGGSCSWELTPRRLASTLGPVTARAVRVDLIPEFRGFPPCSGGVLQVSERNPSSGVVADTPLSTAMADGPLPITTAASGSAVVEWVPGTCVGDHLGFEVVYSVVTLPDDTCSSNKVLTLPIASTIGLTTAAAHASPCAWSIEPAGGPKVYQINLAIQTLDLVEGDKLNVYSRDEVTGARTLVTTFTSASARPAAPLAVMGSIAGGTTAQAVVELVPKAGTADAPAVDATAAGSTFTVLVVPGQCVPGVPLYINTTSGTFNDGSAEGAPMPNLAGGACSWILAPEGSPHSLGPLVLRANRLALVPGSDFDPTCTGGTLRVTGRNPATGEVSDDAIIAVQSPYGLPLVTAQTGSAVVEFVPGTCVGDAAGFELTFGIPTLADDVCTNNTVVTLPVATGIGLSATAAHTAPCTWTIEPSTGPRVFQITLALRELALASGDELRVYSLDRVTRATTLLSAVTGSTLPTMPFVVTGNTTAGRTAAAVVELVKAPGTRLAAGAAASAFQMSVAPGQCIAGVPLFLNATSGSFTDGSAAGAPMVNVAGGSCTWVVAPLSSPRPLGRLVVRAARLDLVTTGYPPCTGGTLLVKSRSPADGVVDQSPLAKVGPSQRNIPMPVVGTASGSVEIEWVPGTCTGDNSGFELQYYTSAFETTLNVPEDGAMMEAGSNVTLTVSGIIPDAFGVRVVGKMNGTTVIDQVVMESPALLQVRLPEVVTLLDYVLEAEFTVSVGDFPPEAVFTRSIRVVPAGYFVLEGGSIVVESGMFVAGEA